MNYVILKHYDHYAIVNDDADFIVGRVYPLDGQGFRVTADLALDWESGDVAVVQTIDDAIPALAAYYERNPPQWQRWNAIKHAIALCIGKRSRWKSPRPCNSESLLCVSSRNDRPGTRIRSGRSDHDADDERTAAGDPDTARLDDNVLQEAGAITSARSPALSCCGAA